LSDGTTLNWHFAQSKKRTRAAQNTHRIIAPYHNQNIEQINTPHTFVSPHIFPAKPLSHKLKKEWAFAKTKKCRGSSRARRHRLVETLG
jgi:hypothetical protein